MNNETSYVLFQMISFKKYFYVSLGNNFYCFCGGPPGCGGPGQLPSLPSLKSSPDALRSIDLLYKYADIVQIVAIKTFNI